MKKPNKTKVKKSASTNTAENKTKSESNNFQETDAPSTGPEEVVRLKGVKFVSYTELFGDKMKTVREMVEGFKRYNSKPKEKTELNVEEREGKEHIFAEADNPEISNLRNSEFSSRKHRRGKPPDKSKKTKLKGVPLPRDPLYHLRPDSDPPFDTWYPFVPGIEVPEEDAMEPVGSFNKPPPRDPEEEAYYDRMRMPTKKEIYDQFMTKRPLVEMERPRKFKPGEYEELMRTRTTRGDLKHFYETGELIVRE